MTSMDVKQSVLQLESLETTDKASIHREDADYSGAACKSDPREIALVRKLDYRIMPTLWCMYFLNYVSRRGWRSMT